MASKKKPKLPIRCDRCAKERDTVLTPGNNLRIPPGWKRHDGKTLCKACKKELFRLRAITLPIAGVLKGGTWQEFCAACRVAWRKATNLANFAVSRLLANDSIRQPGETEWKESTAYKMPEINLYRHLKLDSKRWANPEPYAGREDWNGDKQSASSILRAVKAKYKKRRYETVWLSQAAAATFKYPYPFPVHNQSWSAEYRPFADGNGKTRPVPVVTLTLAGRKWALRLRDGYCVRKHLAGFAQIIKGLALRGELAIYGVPASKGAHLRVHGSRSPGGGNRRHTRILCKMACYLPNDRTEKEKAGTITVRTGCEALLVAQFPEDHFPWVLKNNQIRQKIHAHSRFLQDVGDDMKNERRPRGKRKRTQEKIDAKCRKHDNRIDSFVKETAAHLVAYVVRRKASALEYKDYDRRYLPDRFDGRSGFPWAKLRDRIKTKCEEAGIAFVHIETPQEITLKMSEEQQRALDIEELEEAMETLRQRKAELLAASGEVVKTAPKKKRRGLPRQPKKQKQLAAGGVSGNGQTASRGL